jgi:hypothetical protein
LAHDARGDFLPCVATLGGPLFQVMAMADNHGSGLQDSQPSKKASLSETEKLRDAA